MREMGKLSGVEIEPEKQTRLLNASVSVAGVVGGGVPGGTYINPPFLMMFLTRTTNSRRVRCSMAACVRAAGGHAWNPTARTRRTALDNQLPWRCTDARPGEQGTGCRD
jgi:hypothetical protein